MDNNDITEEQALKELKERNGEAEKLLNNPDKLEKLLQKLEKKIKHHS